MSDEEATQALRVLARHGIDAPVSQRAELIARLAVSLIPGPNAAVGSGSLDNYTSVAVEIAALAVWRAEQAAAAQTRDLTSGEESA